MSDKSPEDQLVDFLSKYLPEIVDLTEEILAKMRSRLKGAVEMVYDNYNALVIGFGPTEKPSEALFSIVVFPRYVSLCFLTGATLPDPNGLLKGDGKVVRNIPLETASVLDKPGVKALMQDAIDRSEKPFNRKSPRRLIIKSISAKQRPRRPSS